MSFISKGWLKGRGRLRGYYPVPISLKSVDLRGTVYRGKEETVGLIATREDGDYHCIRISKDDLDKLLPPLAQLADPSVRERVAMDFLTSIEDATLLLFLNRLLAQRQENERE